MLAGIPQSFCSNCHKLENIGATSYRNVVNEGFKNEFSRIKQTAASGHLHNFTLPFLDIRFSNVCNFKCRICGSENSSAWLQDERILNGKNAPISESSHVVKLKNLKTDVINQLYEKLPTVTNIYFAGGEPLLDENHYLLLEKLIEIGRTDIIISYNTNLSVLKFRKWDLLQLWKQFEHVQVSASIDAIGPALEHSRKGANWSAIEKNLRLIKLFLPDVLISIYPTISVLNCFNITDLIDYFLANNYLKIPRHLNIGFVTEPKHLNLGLLNAGEIASLEAHYGLFLSKIKVQYPVEIYNHIAGELASIISFAKADNLQKFRPKFVQETKMLDLIRNEDTAAVLPELNSVLKSRSITSHILMLRFRASHSITKLKNILRELKP